MTILKRKLYCHTADGVPVFRTYKDGSPLSCWFGLEPTQSSSDEGGDDAFDARGLAAAPKAAGGVFEPDAFRPALEQATSAELRSLIPAPFPA